MTRLPYAVLIALCISSPALVGQAHAGTYLCPTSQPPPTTAETNLMGAISRVFISRWLPDLPVEGSTTLTVSGSGDCVDIVRGSGHFKLYRVENTFSAFELETAAGQTIGRIDFAKLSDAWQTPYTNAYVVFRGLPGAVCDGPAAPHSFGYAPGRCMIDYASVRYSFSVPLVITAFQQIQIYFAPAEVVRSW
jgi:hypothetical protein